MYQEIYTKRLKRDIKKIKKQGKDRQKLKIVVQKLRNGIFLESKYRDHSLQGKYVHCRECHIEPDWLLIYKIDEEENKLYLLRTGSHSELFNESLNSLSELKILNRELNKLIEEFEL